jgi:hypothetical protein
MVRWGSVQTKPTNQQLAAVADEPIPEKSASELIFRGRPNIDKAQDVVVTYHDGAGDNRQSFCSPQRFLTASI